LPAIAWDWRSPGSMHRTGAPSEDSLIRAINSS
jgi:hypothetical protein